MTEAAEKPDLDHLRQWIGRSTEASDIVTAQLVKGLRSALFQDIGEPRAGDAAPWTTHWCLAQPVFPMSMLGPDGHPTRGPIGHGYHACRPDNDYVGDASVGSHRQGACGRTRGFSECPVRVSRSGLRRLLWPQPLLLSG